MEVDEAIAEAMREAVAAGVFRRAARLNKGAAAVWTQFAEPHTRRAATLLGYAMMRLGVEAPSR